MRSIVFLAWTPDSRAILFRADSEVWRVSPDGRTTKLDFDLGEWYDVSGWAIHPDGRQIAFTTVASQPKPESGIWVLENFLSALDGK